MSTDVDARRDLRLAGCSSVPLAGYLKALGVFRLVAAQKDPQAAGRWNEGRFVLSSRLDEDGLEHFLLEEYRPSPIVAPWNGGSGFYPKDNQAGIEAISGSAAPRFATYRVVVALCREILAEGAFEVRPGGEEKVTLLERLRARLPEAALPWLDAAVVLTDGDPKYPPLLGTGGNDGRLDFTNNFMQRLIELFDPSNGGPRSRAASWLRGALFGESIPELAAAAIGQFAPGDAGGANASIGFEGGSLINPWDFVLMLEGAVLFAAASTRRLEAAGHGLLSYPFTVRPVGAGSGSTATQDEGDARAEIWLPLWPRAVGIQELEALLAEGRATVGGRPARDGLDFARAVAALGVDRGIGAFERYGFLMRAGRAYLATPLGRMRVRRQPNVMLVEELEKNRYLDRLRSYARRDEAPGSVRRLVRSLETGLFELARHGGALRLQEVLAVLGDLQRVVGRSPAARAVVPPVPFLSERWAEAADDFTDEYRIAAALAGLYAPGMPMRVHLAPLTPGDRPRHWDPESRLTVWSEGDLLANLAHVLERRLLEADRRELRSKPFAGWPRADLAAVGAFLSGATDDRRIGRLLGGLAFVHLPSKLPLRIQRSEPIPGAFAVLKPLFVDESELADARFLPAGARLPLTTDLVANLATGTGGGLAFALSQAWRRLRIAGAILPRYPSKAPAPVGLSPRRLAAALMVPLRKTELGNLAEAIGERQPLPGQAAREA